MELYVVGADRPALVDDCWTGLLRYRWRLDRQGYVCRRAKGERIYLHHVVLPGKRYPQFVRDHINRDKLDNRSANLRWATIAENAQNTSCHARNQVGFRGVRFEPKNGRYLARVQSNGRAIARRWFDTAADADAFLKDVRPSLLPAVIA